MSRRLIPIKDLLFLRFFNLSFRMFQIVQKWSDVRICTIFLCGALRCCVVCYEAMWFFTVLWDVMRGNLFILYIVQPFDKVRFVYYSYNFICRHFKEFNLQIFLTCIQLGMFSTLVHSADKMYSLNLADYYVRFQWVAYNTMENLFMA